VTVGSLSYWQSFDHKQADCKCVPQSWGDGTNCTLCGKKGDRFEALNCHDGGNMALYTQFTWPVFFGDTADLAGIDRCRVMWVEGKQWSACNLHGNSTIHYGTRDIVDVCAVGHDASMRLCSRCSQGFYISSGSRCEECPENGNAS
jgi:hypothetical protein